MSQFRFGRRSAAGDDSSQLSRMAPRSHHAHRAQDPVEFARVMNGVSGPPLCGTHQPAHRTAFELGSPAGASKIGLTKTCSHLYAAEFSKRGPAIWGARPAAW
jgi:hypothetical protein